MAQAKTFKTEELEQVLNYVKLSKHAQRNRAILLLTHWAGLRVGEVAALRMCDVLDANLTVKSEIRLAPEQTKGGHAELAQFDVSLDRLTMRPFLLRRQAPFFHSRAPSRSSLD